jgi:CMP-N,N'-diacetyllegionaminic acid synthase
MVQQQVICLIPARGGSKGIPLKNIQLLGGKPLLAHSIDQARGCPAVTRVIVSTDHPEVAGVARQYGAQVIQRPDEFANDTATSESALLHALDHLLAEEGCDPDLVVFLQPTSPLRQPDDIAKALMTFHQEQADSLFSACPFHGCVWRRTAGQLASITYDYQHRQRRQDASEDLLENGSIYIFKPWVLRQFNNRLGGRIGVYLMDVFDSFQVDVPADLEFLQRLFSWRYGGLGNG